MFKLNNFSKVLTIISSLTIFGENAYASSVNDLEVIGVGHIDNLVGDEKNDDIKKYKNEDKRLPTWMRFYSMEGIIDTKPGVTVEKISQFDNSKFQVDLNKRSGYRDTLTAQNNFQVVGGESGETNFAIWGKMTLAGYPFLGLIDISQHHMHANNEWFINSNADSGFYKMHASYYDLIFRTANHYKYKFDTNGSSHSLIKIKPFNESFHGGEQTLQMEMPFIHLSSMPEGYYLTEDQAKLKGFDFKAFNKGEKWYNEHQMVITKPDGSEFYFQTCMPQSNLNYNEETKEISCELPSGLPEKIPGCAAIYYFADGKASMYCNDGLLNGHINPNQSTGKWKTYFRTSEKSLYNCKIGSLTADKTKGIKCDLDDSVKQPNTDYLLRFKTPGSDDNTQKEEIKLLPNSETFNRY